VTPLELQVVHSLDPTIPAFANLQYAGVGYDAKDGLLLFGVSTYGRWSTQNDVAFNIYIDSQNNGTFDKVLFNSSPGMMASALFGNGGANGQDVFISAFLDIAKGTVGTEQFVNLFDPTQVDTRLFANNTMVIAASPQDLGLAGTKFRYRIETCPGFEPVCALNGFRYDSAAGPYTFDLAAPGLDFGGQFMDLDLNGASLPVNFNIGNLLANHSQGALLLHTHNFHGVEAQAVPLEAGRAADLAVTSSVSPASPAAKTGVVVTLTVQAQNAGPNTAHGVVVFNNLPDSLSYVSDDGGGAFDPSTGLWTVGQLAVGKSATIHIKAKVVAGGAILVTSRRAQSQPLDPNPLNDISSVTVQAPRLADLAVSASASASGRAATFTVHLKNNGPDPSYNPRVNLILGGAHFDGATVTTSQGTFTASSGIWQLGSVASGATETLTFTVHVQHAGSAGISATATAQTADPSTINNHAAASVTVH